MNARQRITAEVLYTHTHSLAFLGYSEYNRKRRVAQSAIEAHIYI